MKSIRQIWRKMVGHDEKMEKSSSLKAGNRLILSESLESKVGTRRVSNPLPLISTYPYHILNRKLLGEEYLREFVSIFGSYHLIQTPRLPWSFNPRTFANVSGTSALLVYTEREFITAAQTDAVHKIEEEMGVDRIYVMWNTPSRNLTEISKILLQPRNPTLQVGFRICPEQDFEMLFMSRFCLLSNLTERILPDIYLQDCNSKIRSMFAVPDHLAMRAFLSEAGFTIDKRSMLKVSSLLS